MSEPPAGRDGECRRTSPAIDSSPLAFVVPPRPPTPARFRFSWYDGAQGRPQSFSNATQDGLPSAIARSSIQIFRADCCTTRLRYCENHSAYSAQSDPTLMKTTRKRMRKRPPKLVAGPSSPGSSRGRRNVSARGAHYESGVVRT